MEKAKRTNEDMEQKKQVSQEIPYFAIGNNELRELPVAGEMAKCKNCGGEHPIEYGMSQSYLPDGSKTEPVLSKDAGFIKCGEKVFLASLQGRLL